MFSDESQKSGYQLWIIHFFFLLSNCQRRCFTRWGRLICHFNSNRMFEIDIWLVHTSLGPSKTNHCDTFLKPFLVMTPVSVVVFFLRQQLFFCSKNLQHPKCIRLPSSNGSSHCLWPSHSDVAWVGGHLATGYVTTQGGR